MNLCVVSDRSRLASSLLILSLAFFSACDKKQPAKPAQVAAPPPPPVAATAAARPVPKQEYNDPALQARYEAEFNQNVSLFAPPERGTPMALRLTDGSFIGGALLKVTPDEVSVRQGNESLVATRKDIDPPFLPEVYNDEFAKQMAVAELAAPTNLPAAPIDSRFAIRDDMSCHSGPGTRYQQLKDINLPRGTKMNVWQRRGRWLLVGTSSKSTDRLFWVDYFQTMSLVDDPKADYSPYIQILREHGILIRLDPEQSEAFVNADAWVGTDAAVQEGISRVLAAHFAITRKTSVVWVDIKTEQGKRLARYTRAQGFRAL